jgi:hypothetical protein
MIYFDYAISEYPKSWPVKCFCLACSESRIRYPAMWARNGRVSVSFSNVPSGLDFLPTFSNHPHFLIAASQVLGNYLAQLIKLITLVWVFAIDVSICKLITSSRPRETTIHIFSTLDAKGHSIMIPCAEAVDNCCGGYRKLTSISN